MPVYLGHSPETGHPLLDPVCMGLACLGRNTCSSCDNAIHGVLDTISVKDFIKYI